MYVGDITTMSQYNKAVELNLNKDRNKYSILLKGKEKDDNALVLDCYWHYMQGECLASAANDSRKCKFVDSIKQCKDNVKIAISHTMDNDGYVVKLVCINDIEKDEEILVSYGKSYWRLKYI